MICTLQHSHDKAYADLTGRFSYKSSNGNEYILIIDHVYSNAILGFPIKNRQTATIKNAWEKINKQFHQANSNPTLWILDNFVRNIATYNEKTKYNLPISPSTISLWKYCRESHSFFQSLFQSWSIIIAFNFFH